MHHLGVSERDDKGLFAVDDDLPSGNNECIAFHRGAFIQYCLENNVSLVLSGHTHENAVLTSLGTNPGDPFEWPLFVQTDSATLNGQKSGGRVIIINNSVIESYEYLPFS